MDGEETTDTTTIMIPITTTTTLTPLTLGLTMTTLTITLAEMIENTIIQVTLSLLVGA